MMSPNVNLTIGQVTWVRSLAEERKILPWLWRPRGKGMRCFTGKTRSADATRKTWDRAVIALSELADQAAQGGIGLVLETHDLNLLDTLEGTFELLDWVNYASVGMIFRPSTSFPDRFRVKRALGDRIFHVHANNGRNGQRTYLASGIMDWDEIISELIDLGFKGFISMEWFGEQPAEVAQPERKALRNWVEGPKP